MQIKKFVSNLTILSIYILSKEVKKILRNYRQYIQKIDNKINYEKYEQIKVSTFTDLLEIRDTLQQPILMITEDSNTKFIVPTNKRKVTIWKKHT